MLQKVKHPKNATKMSVRTVMPNFSFHVLQGMNCKVFGREFVIACKLHCPLVLKSLRLIIAHPIPGANEESSK